MMYILNFSFLKIHPITAIGISSKMGTNIAPKMVASG